MGNKKHIIFYQRVLWAGGTEQVVFDLAHNFNPEKYEIHIIYLYKKETSVIFAPHIHLHNAEEKAAELVKSKRDVVVKSCLNVLDNILDELEIKKTNKPIDYSPERVPLAVNEYDAFSFSPYSIFKTGNDRDSSSIMIKVKRIFLKAGDKKIRNIINSILDRLKPSRGVLEDRGVDESKYSQEQRLFFEASVIVLNLWAEVMAVVDILSEIDGEMIWIAEMEESTVRAWLSQFLNRNSYMTHLHTVESIYLPLLYPDKHRIVIENKLFSKACQNALVVSAPTGGGCREMIEWYNVPEEKTRLMRDPIHLSRIREKASATVNYPDSIQNRKVLVYVSRLDITKNPHLLIDACGILKTKCEGFKLFLLGDGYLKHQVENWIKENNLQNNVELLGQKTNPFPFIAMARGLVLTSKFEGFALVLVEAIALGAIPISVDCPYGPREILKDNEYGLLVPQDDAPALAEAMNRIINDDALYATLKSKGAQHVEYYDIGKVVHDWEELFDTIGNPY